MSKMTDNECLMTKMMSFDQYGSRGEALSASESLRRSAPPSQRCYGAAGETPLRYFVFSRLYSALFAFIRLFMGNFFLSAGKRGECRARNLGFKKGRNRGRKGWTGRHWLGLARIC